MAFSFFRYNSYYLKGLRHKSRNIFSTGTTFFRGRALGDNRGYAAVSEGQSRHVEDKPSISKTSFVDNKPNVVGNNINIDKNDGDIPHNVRLIRKKLRSLHGIDTGCNLERRPLTQQTVSDEPDDYYKLDEHLEAEPTTEPVKSDQIQKTFSFLRKQRSDPSERVIETLYGFVRLDTDVVQNRTERSFEKAQSDYFENSESKYVKDSDRSSKQSHSESKLRFNSSKRKEKVGSHPETVEQNASDAPPAGHVQDHQFINARTGKGYDDVKHDSSENIFDTQFFGQMEEQTKENVKNSNRSTTGDEFLSKRANIFDEQYFESDAQPTHKQLESSSHSERVPDMNERLDDTSFIDQQYFGKSSENTSSFTKLDVDDKGESLDLIDEQYFAKNHSSENNISDVTQIMSNNRTSHEDYSTGEAKINDASESRDTYVNVKTKREIILEKKVKPNIENPQSAYDLAMKIRKQQKSKMATESSTETRAPQDAKWLGETDSKGFRILKSQVLNIQNMPREVVVKLLKDSILYEDDGLIAIDKPYGLPSHGGPGVHHSVGQLLEPLAEKCRLLEDKLYLIHRLDKETTGVMLLAKNERSQSVIHDMFVKQRVVKKYWMITKGIPEPPEGVIDIPMGEGTVGDKVRMTLKPRYPKEYKLMVKTSRRQHCYEAVTNYKVLDSNHQAALVECQPETGVKHQIRCHMAFALNTPILGDHKYSHFSKLAPQKLHPEILQRLGIRQAKVRHVPMHLHARLIVLPEYLNGRNLFITANLPKHFRQNMKWLKLSPP